MKSKVIATIAVIAVTVSILTLAAGPASAWTHRRHVGFPPFSALNFYSSPRHPIRYYSGCGYGDCPCLRRIALALVAGCGGTDTARAPVEGTSRLRVEHRELAPHQHVAVSS